MFFKEEYIENYDFSLNKFTLVNIVDNFLEITLNRNEKKNALSTEMIKELAVCTDYANTKKERISFLQHGWCIDTNDVLAWTLVDQNGNLYGYTAEELYNIPDSTYKKMQKYMRVKQVVFRDIDFKDDIEKD